MEKTITLVATAAFGLESVVRRECEAMGFAPHVEEGHLSFEASLRDIARCNMCLRSAERVFVEIGQFSATSFAAFFDAIEALPWPDWMDATARFPVQAASYRSQLASVSDLQRLAKKAIAKRLGRAYGYEILPETGAMYAVHCRLRKDVCRVLLDTSGVPLFQRGYRADRGRAPLKETLAHGLVALSVWTPDRMLVDPFCGSGTILIEAALRARNMAPGADRSFASMDWPCVGRAVYTEVRREALAQMDLRQPLSLMGFDIDEQVLRIARKNADKAGVGADITFVTKDMREVGFPENFGVVITNPPYGKRLGEKEAAESLLRDFATRMRALRTWSVSVITPDREMEAMYGRAADRRRKFFNGGMEVTDYQFYGPNPKSFR